ncbi:MAG TPA: gamma-glutamyltransferase [Burkholderiales bacterium]|nr:gamma-glutamyltransferase [Burkholderiales bacterium]
MTFSWDLPYPSQRSPLLARNVVATSQPLGAQAGLRMLLKGGNAVDAAVATAITLTVVEPTMNGIGSDAFALVWAEGKLHGLNASGRAPAAWSPARFAGRDSVPTEGWDAVTVPGAVSGWVALSQRFGRLPFADLFEPAIEYAERGYLVSPVVAKQWSDATERLSAQPTFRQAFMPGGRAPKPGELFRFPDQGKTLGRIAQTKGEAFYRGDLAAKIAAASASQGGAMTAADLAAHRADWVEPIDVSYRDHTLHEIPPNGQGIAALMALGMLREWELTNHPVDSVDSVHLQIEAMKLAFADVYRQVADPDAMKVKPRDLLNADYLRQRAHRIDRKRASDFGPGTLASSDTVYLTAADAQGMMVSYIQSNYMGFGSGVVVPGTGVSLQNRGACFTLQPGHPNQVGGGKRPFHTIIPAFLTRDGKPVMSFGVMGGDMQPQGHLQMTVRLLDYGQNPQAAADAPRWKVSKSGEVLLEPSIATAVVEGLRDRGHRVRVSKKGEVEIGSYGSAQLIYRVEDGYITGSEGRRDGQAVGY